MVTPRGGQDAKVKRDDPFRAEVLEALAELYLRLNGYFCIRNYLQHRIAQYGLNTESDLLAIRMPYQEELLEDGRRQSNDYENLVLPARLGMIDCLIVEVKGWSVEFNESVRKPEGRERIVAVLRMFGVFATEMFGEDGVADRIATDLHTQIRAQNWAEYANSSSKKGGISVRMLVFAPGWAKHAKSRKHLDLQHVLDFTRERMRPAKGCSVYRGPDYSPWRGSTRAIVQILDQNWAPEDVGLPLDRFVENTVALLKSGSRP